MIDQGGLMLVFLNFFFSYTLIGIITNIFHFNRKILKVDCLKHYLSHNLPHYLLH